MNEAIATANAVPTMVPVADVRRIDPDWHFSPDVTYRLIRQGRLGCVRVGRRVLLRKQDLIDFQAAHAVPGGVR